MNSLNNIMNRIDVCGKKEVNGIAQGWVNRHVLTRFNVITRAFPCEIAACFQNLFSTPVKAGGAIFGLGVKAVRLISSAEVLKKMDESLPTVRDFLKTVAKVVGYAVGSLFTATLGLICPTANFRLHCYAGLTTDLRLKKIQDEIENEKQIIEQKAASDEQIKQRNLDTVLDALHENQAKREPQGDANDPRVASEDPSERKEDFPIFKPEEEDIESAAAFNSAEFTEEYDLDIEDDQANKSSFFARLFGFGKQKPEVNTEVLPEEETSDKAVPSEPLADVSPQQKVG